MIVLLIACQIETNLSEEVADNDAAGTIAVSPATLSLSAPLGELDTDSVWIENVGMGQGRGRHKSADTATSTVRDR